MTNTEALELMLRLFTTAEFAEHAARSGVVPSQDDLQKFCHSVARASAIMITKMIEDDSIPEWEVDERLKAIIKDVANFTKRSKQ